jgi:acyl-CoA thioester hydrolase
MPPTRASGSPTRTRRASSTTDGTCPTSIEYLAPARFDDLIEVFVRIERIGRTSATYDLAAFRVDDDVLMVTAKQTAVLVDLAGHTPVPIPDEFRERIASFEGVTV